MKTYAYTMFLHGEICGQGFLVAYRECSIVSKLQKIYGRRKQG